MEEIAPLTPLLGKCSSGRKEVADEIIPILYRELRKVTAARPRADRSGHALQPTAPVNEAYLKLVGSSENHASNTQDSLADVESQGGGGSHQGATNGFRDRADL